MIGARTRERLPDGAALEALPEFTVKGKAQPVAAFVLHGIR